jgi:hypothetical protein
MIGKTIKSILTTNSALIALVPAVNIFPYVCNEGTAAPAIVYSIESLVPEYTKGSWVCDTITFSINSFAKDYNTLSQISSAVRTALELNQTGYSTQNINRIYLQSMDEGYDLDNDVFGNKLTFVVKINSY